MGEADDRCAARPLIDLVFDENCPHVESARAVLRAALRRTGVETGWREWTRDGPTTPAELRRFGSPTILVNGVDVMDDHATHDSDASCCRIYVHADGLQGAPPLRSVVAALSACRTDN